MEDCASILRVLARSATGQEMSSYTTFSNGIKRENDIDGVDLCDLSLGDVLSMGLTTADNVAIQRLVCS